MRMRQSGSDTVVPLLVVVCFCSSALAAFDTADLSGTWSIHGVVSGADPNVPGSFYVTGAADSNGTAQGFYYSDSQGIYEATWAGNSPVSLSLAGDGIVTLDGDEALLHGVMNWDEDLIVSVTTGMPGPDTGLMGHNLWMWVKQSSSPAFSLSDGTGTWWLHGLTSSIAESYWSHGRMEIDALGHFSFAEGTWILSSDPDPNTPEDGAITLTEYGVVGFSFDAAAHGVMNPGKDLVVFTMAGQGGGNLSILQKRSGVAFSTSDLVGTWRMHALSAAEPGKWNGWFYGTADINDAGVFSGAAINPHSTNTFSEPLSFTSEGILTGMDDQRFHGTMSDDKNLIVATLDDGGGGADLMVLTRAVVSPVYRFWSPQNSRHFYTVSTVEKNYVQATFASNIWTYETEAYYAFPKSGQTGLAPVYRFWSNLLGAHFYTISEAERDYVIDNLPAWTYEGPVFYAYPEGSQPVEASPVYRFWSDTLSTHFYTINEAEKDYVINNLPAWEYETIAWYAYD